MDATIAGEQPVYHHYFKSAQVGDNGMQWRWWGVPTGLSDSYPKAHSD